MSASGVWCSPLMVTADGFMVIVNLSRLCVVHASCSTDESTQYYADKDEVETI